MALQKFLEPLWQAGAEVYEVGGPVRDRILKRETKDHDLLACKIPIDRLKNILQPFGKVAAVGKAFGVLKFTPYLDPSITIDIALPRKEISTGSGHRDFQVDFDPNLPVQEDLGRRDFTFNAMALHLKTGELIDPFNGKQDLENRILRQVFPKAFEEDPLRLIRAVQFAARFGMTIEPVTLESLKKNASLIATVSPERIIEEIKKLFSAPIPSVGLEFMREAGLLRHVLPELEALQKIEQDKLPGDDVYRHTLRVLDATRADEYLDHPGDMELMLAALFHDVGKATTKRFDKAKDRVVFYGHQLASKRMAKKWLEKMKVTTIGVDPKRVETLVEHHMFETKSYFTDKAIRRFVAKIGQDLIYKLIDLRLADNRGGKHPKSINGVLKMRKRVQDELAKKPPFGPGDLALNGHDLMSMGIPAGPQMGKILKHLVEIVLDDPELNTRERLEEIVKHEKK
ncbi:MAG: HD domain-containing protein [Deltaproteobacteria bacterium]|nr:HD domain-containing protein [Deltaproteobacteria bacterium]